MSKEILAHIFEPFYTNKDVGKGTGMGLAMVHGIMDNVKGHIIVETEEDKGTLFRLLFKSSEKMEAGGLITALADDISVRDARGCILLVDDDVAVLDYMTSLLTTNGYEVIKCGDGEAALTLFQEPPNEFDLVITDQTMPKLTGVELSKQLIKIRPDISIILTTGYSEIIDKAQAEAIGIRSYLEKPAMPDQILKNINDVLSKVA
jgi:CheY-like chemotaxis protein